MPLVFEVIDVRQTMSREGAVSSVSVVVMMTDETLRGLGEVSRQIEISIPIAMAEHIAASNTPDAEIKKFVENNVRDYHEQWERELKNRPLPPQRLSAKAIKSLFGGKQKFENVATHKELGTSANNRDNSQNESESIPLEESVFAKRPTDERTKKI